jgi:hypothetical protein
MSQITALYDALHALVTATLPNALRLPNAYALAANPEHLLSNGYAVVAGSAVNTEESLSGRMTLSREFRIMLTRRLSALATDAASKGTAEKLILEDITLLTKRFESDAYLNGSGSPDVCYAKFNGDEGISLVDETSFITCSANFTIKYFEKL